MHDTTVWKSITVRGHPPSKFTSKTTAGAISHQTSTADASLMIHVHLLSRSLQTVTDDAHHHLYHDHVYVHQMAMAILTYNEDSKIHTIN